MQAKCQCRNVKRHALPCYCLLSDVPSRRAYDVIVCDLRMPELDGPAFYAVLTRQYPALRQRVIFLTGDTGGDASRTFLTQSGRPWFRQPSPMTTIRRAIQYVLQAAPPAEA